jgi:formylglycine-generating enzyme required for sulfatase activity
MEFVPIEGLDGVLFSRWETRVRDFGAFASVVQREPEEIESVGTDGWKNRQDTWRHPGFEQNGQHPVVGVNWHDAVEFCNWLTRKEVASGDLKQGQRYRLPRDCEWSIAAGLNTESGKTPEDLDSKIRDVFPWGKEWPPPDHSGNFAGEELLKTNWPSEWGCIVGYSDSFAMTSPVGASKPNTFGLCDMSGNVWEWCIDSMSPSNNAKVLRGGAWNSGKPRELFTSYRHCDLAARRIAKYGFRCVLDVSTNSP